MPFFLLLQGINGAENPEYSFNKYMGGLKNQQVEYFCRSRTSVDEYDKSSHGWDSRNRWLTIKPLDLKQKGQRTARSLFPLNLLTAALSFIRARGWTQATLCPSGDGLILTAAAVPTAPQRKDGNRIWPPNAGPGHHRPRPETRVVFSSRPEVQVPQWRWRQIYSGGKWFPTPLSFM